LDCPYFAVVIVTTVGYGDILPKSDNAKLFTAFYVLFALTLGSIAILAVVDSLANFQIEKKKEHQALFRDKDAKARERRERQERREKLIKSTLRFAALLLSGTTVSALGRSWERGSAWVNGFYYTTITLTTVGFGDYAPIEDWEKVYKMAVMLVGIPVFAECLSNFSELLFAEKREQIRLRLVKGGLTPDKFHKFKAFSKELAAAGGGNDGDDGKIAPFEFLTFVLIENGLLKMTDVSEAMDNFREIDKTGTGFIEEGDLDCGCTSEDKQKKQTN